MSDELMPCPFCGGEARIHHHNDDGWFASCDLCDAQSSFLDTPNTVRVAWNRRAPVVHLAPDFSITINAPAGGGGVIPIGCGLTPLPESSDGVP